MKKRKCVMFVLLCAVLAASSCGKKPAGEPETTSPAEAAVEYPFTDAQGLAFSRVFAYTGAYVEDGSNDTVNNVAAIRVENRSEQTVRYAEITVATGAGDLRFTCTTLPPGRNALLMELNRASYTGAQTSGVELNSRALFDEPLTLYPDTFSIEVRGHVMTLKNISGKPVAGEINVYYKRADAQGYLGGITYRIRFSDLAAGAQASQSAQNLSDSDCDILFISCENPPEVRS